MKSIYQIPLIPQDLRQEENIIQIADVLDHLNNVIDDIFTKLNTRIEENMKRTRMIQNRINVCNNKVDKLLGTNKATRVVCSAKYPAMECHMNIESIFKETTKGEIVRTHRDIKTKPVVYSEKETQDKLEFYHVKVNSQDPVQAVLENSLPRYHDSPPAELKAVGCLMVYGSEEVVYGSGSRGGGTMVQAAKEATERGPPSPLHEPPATVATRETPSRGQHLYLYSPNMEEVPTLDMPQDLPHLSGIAGDMRFQFESEPTIAPSARAQGLTSSPMFIMEAPQEQKPTSVIIPEKEQTPPIVSQIVEKPRAEEIKVEKTAAQVVPPPSHGAPPPPPLPPMTPLEETDSKASIKSAVKRTETSSAPVDSRANLMEAIRNAGGSGKARLRSVTSAATATKKDNTNKTASSGGGDLMADLHAKLSMRRKGISGARQGGAEGTILSALSAIIPPPPDADPQSNSEVSSTEDDWE